MIGYNGSPTSEQALLAAASLFSGRPALLAVVWEPEAAYAFMDPTAADPLTAPGLGAIPLDPRVAQSVEDSLEHDAQRLANQGVVRARAAGLEAEPLVVIDAVGVSVALVKAATDHQASVLVIGAHGHRSWHDRFLGNTTKDVMESAPCPVLIVRPTPTEGTGAE